MSRITLEMNGMDAILAVGEGNPGALRVCMDLLNEAADIDPDDFMGGLGKVLWLDAFEVYGSRVWMLYKDVCKQNLSYMVAVMRAVQLGIISQVDLNRAIDNMGEGLILEDVITLVQDRLPEFVVIETVDKWAM